MFFRSKTKSQRSTTTCTSTRRKGPAWKTTSAAKTSDTRCAFANTPTPAWLSGGQVARRAQQDLQAPHCTQRALGRPSEPGRGRLLGEHLPNAHALVPTLQSSFERFTLIHVGQVERITFDQDLQPRCLRPTQAKTTWVRPTPHLAVVEWKQSNVNHRGELIQAIRVQKGRRGPLGRTLRLSKFVLGHIPSCPNETSEAAALRCVTWRVLNITLQTRPSRRNRF